MSVPFDPALVLNSLVNELKLGLFFVLITTKNGVVVKSYINEDEFNKASISLNISQLYELAEEVSKEVGLQSPDFNIIHSSNYLIMAIKILKNIIILLTTDQVKIGQVFQIINETISID